MRWAGPATSIQIQIQVQVLVAKGLLQQVAREGLEVREFARGLGWFLVE